MANITRIKNNQITDSTIEYTKIKPGTLTGTVFNPDLTLNSNITILGNLSVTGESSTINSTDTYVNDPLIVFNNGYSGTPSFDIGIIANRNLGALPGYGNMNTAFIWSETDGAWIAIATTETGATTGSINNSGWANVKVGNLAAVSADLTGSLTVAGNAEFNGTLDITGDLTFNTATVASVQALAIGNVTPGTGAFTTLTTTSTIIASGNIVAASGTASTNTTTGALIVNGGVGVTGAVNAGSLTDNGVRVITGVTSTGAGNVTIGGTNPDKTLSLTETGPGATAWGGATQLPYFTTDVYGRVVTAGNIALNTIAITELGNTAEITSNATVGTAGLSLVATDVTAGTYGDANNVPQFTVDSKGRLTFAGNVAIETAFNISGTDASSAVIDGGETLEFVGTYGVTITVGENYANIGTPQDLQTSANPEFNNLVVASLQADAIGNVTAGSGAFTTGEFSSTLDVTGETTLTTATAGGLQAKAIGNVTPGTGAFTSLTADTETVGGLQAVAIGNVTPGSGAFTSISSSTTYTLNTGTAASLQATAIGNVTPGTAAFTTATAGGLQATAIGNVTPGTAVFTDLTSFGTTSLGLTDAVAINDTPIGNATPSTGAFTTLTASGATTVTDTTQSTNATSGALIVDGGVGIAKNLNVGGDAVITGNLTVQGDVTTINAATLDVEDLNITVAKGAADGAAANGGGLTVDGAGATFTYASADDSWNVNKLLNVNDSTGSTSISTGALVVDGGAGIAENLYVGGLIQAGTATFASINNTPIGNATPSTGAFTTLTAQTETVGGLQAVAIGNVTPGTGAFTSVTVGESYMYESEVSTGTVVAGTGNLTYLNVGGASALNTVTAASLQAVAIGNVTPGTGAFTSVSADTETVGGLQAVAIGNVTPGTAVFTTVEAGGLQAVAIGNVTPGTGAFTTVTTTGTIISDGNIVAAATTDSTTNDTGSFIAKGGVGIAGNINVGAYGQQLAHSIGGNLRLGNPGSIASTLLDINPNDEPSQESTSVVHATGKSGTSAKITLDSMGTGAASLYLARSARGTSAVPSASQHGDISGGFIFRGYGATGYLIAAPSLSTGIYAVAAENFTDTAQGQTIVINTTPIGSNSAVVAMKIDASGNVVITSQDQSHGTTTGALVVKGGIGLEGNVRAGGSIYAAGVNDTPIGNYSPSTGAFTQLYVDDITATSIQAQAIGNVAPGTAEFTTLNASGQVTFSSSNASTSTSTGAVVVDGGIGVGEKVYALGFEGPIGAASPNSGYFTTGDFSSTLDVLGETTLDTTIAASLQAAAIGNVTPGTAAFTTLSASGVTTITNSTISTSTSTGALVVSGGAGFGSNVFVSTGLVVNESQAANADTLLLGKSDSTLLWTHASNSYDQVLIGGSATTGDLVEGAKLQINSTDAMLLPVGSSSDRPGSTGYSDVEGMFRYNTTIGAIEWYTGAIWQTATTTFTVITDEQFNGDGITTDFQLGAGTTTASTIVSINGVVQIPSLAYSITGASNDTLTFTEAPDNGDIIDVRRLTTTQTLVGVASPNSKNAFQTDNDGVYIYTGSSTTRVTTSWDTAGNEVSNRANVTVSSADTATTLVTMDASLYRSGKFVVQASHGTDYQVMEALVIHDGTTASVMAYGVVQTNGNLGVLSATYTSGNVLLQFVASNTSTIVRTKSDFLTI